MLILTRKSGQSFFIGKHADITVKVLTNDGNAVRIGIDAPKEILILREEVCAEQLDSVTARKAKENSECVAKTLAVNHESFTQIEGQ